MLLVHLPASELYLENRVDTKDEYSVESFASSSLPARPCSSEAHFPHKTAPFGDQVSKHEPTWAVSDADSNIGLIVYTVFIFYV